MAAAVAILDALRKKPMAEKKKQFSVAFFVAPKDKSQDKRQEQEPPRANEEDRPMVQIVDKTSLKLVKRKRNHPRGCAQPVEPRCRQSGQHHRRSPGSKA
jgi:hypothetical protein